MSSTTTTRPKTNRSIQGQKNTHEISPQADLIEYVKEYAREKPEVAALWCLGIGFVLGWKLKPW